MSTAKLKNRKYFVITSSLGKLLAQRNLSQKELARITGISERAISRIKNRKVVNRIDCDSAIRICLALSLEKSNPRPRQDQNRIGCVVSDGSAASWQNEFPDYPIGWIVFFNLSIDSHPF